METITIKTTEWNVEAMTGYKPITTFWTDFSIAENFGVAAIIDTCKRALCEWNDGFATIYNSLWEKVDAFACANLHGEELDYFYTTLD